MKILKNGTAVLLLLPTVHGIDWQPFQYFLPVFQDRYGDLMYENCSADFHIPHDQSRWCERGIECILENLSSQQQWNMNGASILLGITPTILSNFAPSTESLAFLSMHRPLLSFILSIGTPSMRTIVPLGHVDPLAPVLEVTTVTSLDQNRFQALARYHNGRWSPLINILEYVFAIAAAFNVVYLSYTLTIHTVVGWSCPNYAWVLGWSSMSAFIQLWAMFVFRLTVRPNETTTDKQDEIQLEDRSQSRIQSAEGHLAKASDRLRAHSHTKKSNSKLDSSRREDSPHGGMPRQPLPSWTEPSPWSPLQAGSYEPTEPDNPVTFFPSSHRHHRYEILDHESSSRAGSISFLWHSELQPCAQRVLPTYCCDHSVVSQVLRAVGPAASFVQYIGGTGILAGLFPVIANDAFPIVARYSASAIVVQVIAYYELSGFQVRNKGWDNGGGK